MESGCFEKKIVQAQLGRELRNEFRVVKRCTWGYPQCIQSDLITDGKPFPTLFWLTCPFLYKEVSRLEEKGWVKLLEEELEHSESMSREYIEAHKTTQALKKSLLADRKLENWQIEALLDRGIGGIRNLMNIKCLHLQLANFLGGIDNPIGKRVWEMLKSRECPGSAVICSSLEVTDEKGSSE
ncbi:hypothetical protein AT15_00935 [Kosmotoga arenicorallina S304]|uniref:DUF501 domain-containing protein n=1 Tax=Kosmotoga arenicorallina S304 TaxID=1453497 RepID=A0A176K0P3_9BACT|nr:DUF501 domain-containing protein [Kosmotoga arenicorallina]OAA30111.1 hypothetical protein AT15_00935 [Kosmotoga arenicorallina S304]